MRIHREGNRFIVFLLLALAVINILVWVLLYKYIWPGLAVFVPSLYLVLQVLWFFRNPPRNIQPDEGKVVSAADGKVVAIEVVNEEEVLQKEVVQVSVFMSIYNVHANRYPVTGKIVYYKYHAGNYLVARHPKSSELNERNTIGIETSKFGVVVVRQIAGFVARRIICQAVKDVPVVQGQEMGFIKFGSRVDIFLPKEAKLQVKIGDKVKANKSVIAIAN